MEIRPGRQPALASNSCLVGSPHLAARISGRPAALAAAMARSAPFSGSSGQHVILLLTCARPSLCRAQASAIPKSQLTTGQAASPSPTSGVIKGRYKLPAHGRVN